MKKQNFRLRSILAILLLATGICSCQQVNKVQSYDLLISKATIVDGTGEKPYVANLLINGDSIALIDKDTSNTYQVSKTINAKGMVLAPGFIDPHAHGNPMETPEFKNFIAMGVTTISLGQDGFSTEKEDIRDWMQKVNQANPAVNIAMFAGHNSLRMQSGIAYDTIPSEEKMAAMEQLLRKAMNAGCFGLTTGLEYNPGYYAGSNELNRLAKVVGEKNGLIMSHMRNEDDAYVASSIRELLEQGKYCPVHVSHIKVVYGKGAARAKEILSLLDSARTKGIQVTADLYPYTASYTGIGILFPDWAKEPNDYQQVLKTRRAELQEFLKNKIALRNGPEATLIGSGTFKGKTLAQVSTELNKTAAEVLMDDIGPYGADGAYFIMDEALQEELLKDPYVMVCTDGSPTMTHPRGYGAFAKVIETYVVKQKALSLEEAVRKMSGLPAQTIGLTDRGLIKEGYKADVVIFDPSEVKENATYDNPHQLASGFRYVIVNGTMAKKGEEFSQQRAGKVLKKQVAGQ